MRWLTIAAFFLNLFSAVAQTPAFIHYGVQDGLPGNHIYCGLQDKQGLIWLGTDKGLACFDGVRFRIFGKQEGLPDPDVLNMKEDLDGRIWLFCFRKKPCYFWKGTIITEKQDTTLVGIVSGSGLYNLGQGPEKGNWFFSLDANSTFYDGQKATVIPQPGRTFNMFRVAQDFLIMSADRIAQYEGPGNQSVVFKAPPGQGSMSISVSGHRILYAFADELRLLEWQQGTIRMVSRLPRPTGNLFTDSSGRFWVCSPGNGAICFDNPFRDLSHPTYYLPGKKVTAMFEDHQGTFWFCTAGEGVWALPANAAINYQGGFFPSNNLRSITGDASGAIYIGDDLGNVHTLQGSSCRSIQLGAADGYNLIRQIIPSERGFLAISDEYLFDFDKIQNRIRRFIPNRSLKSAVVRNDSIWFASAVSLGRFTENMPGPEAIVSKRYTAIGMDDDGYVWAGNMDGLFAEKDRFKQNQGEIFPELNGRIMCIQNDRRGNLWVATPENGLIRCKTVAGNLKSAVALNQHLPAPINNIQQLFIGSDGTVWMATNRGVYGLKPDGAMLHLDHVNGLVDDDVNAVYVSQDTLWAATVAGLTKVQYQIRNEKVVFKTLLTSIQYQQGKQFIRQYFHPGDDFQASMAIQPGCTNLTFALGATDFISRGNIGFEVVQNKTLLPFWRLTFDNILSTLFENDLTTQIINSTEYVTGINLPPGGYQFTFTAISSVGVKSRQPVSLHIHSLPFWYETIWFYLAIWSALAYFLWRIVQYRVAYKEMETAMAGLQLKALQSQMNPHFIGNSINAVNQFLHPPDPLKVSEYIALFVRLLRHTMDVSEALFIPFEEEVNYCKEYFQLVQLRYGEHFQFRIKGAETIDPQVLFPSMILQPFLENATIHGRAAEGVSVVSLLFEMKNDILYCSVTDNGMGITAGQERKNAARKHHSKGIQLVRSRILALNRIYGTDISLSIEDLSEKNAMTSGTCVCLHYSISRSRIVAKK